MRGKSGEISLWLCSVGVIIYVSLTPTVGLVDRICVVRNLGMELDRYPNRTSAGLGLFTIHVTVHVT